MNIFKTGSKNGFISEIVNFICSNYSEDFSKLKILLPNGLTCSELQKSLIKSKGTTILPTIVPISELVAEEEEIFKIPSTQFAAVTSLEEKISLAEIIYSYKKLNYNLLQSLRLSTSLAQLFFEFESNQLLFENIKDLPTLDESEHWRMIYSFLHFAQEKWSEKIKTMNKISRATHESQAFQAEINRLRNNPEQALIIAGVIGDNQITNIFIKKALELKNFTLILPPFDQHTLKNKLSFDNPLYKIQKFILSLEQNNNINLKTLGEPKENIIDKLIHQSKSEIYNDNIEYIELENIFHEAEYIALKCQEHIKNHIKSNICLIVHSQEMKEHIALFLQKYELNYNDLFGN
jgi:inactivated superfamily I helicase